MIIQTETATGTQQVWLAERIILRKQARDAASRARVTVDTASETIELAEYSPIMTGALYSYIIDITDFLRAYKNDAPFEFAVRPDDDTEDFVTIEVAGLINPSGVLIPEDEEAMWFATIQPPSVMIAAEGFGSQLVEIRASRGYVTQKSAGEWTLPTLLSDVTTVEISDNTTEVRLYAMLPRPEERLYVLRPMQCGRRYAIVEWESFTGVIRRHIMEICKQTGEVADSYSLAEMEDQFKEIKGRTDGFTLRLEGLRRYDVWYYSDMLTSSSVRVTIDGENWYGVSVEPSEYTIPDGDGGELTTLEIPIKFRQYDAVSLQ